MASLYKRGNYWWVKFKDSRGNIQRESTGLRVSNRHDWIKALDARAALAAKEPRWGASASKAMKLDAWVEPFISLRYSGLTKARVASAWRNIREFLVARNITDTRQITRIDCLDYLTHRTGGRLSASPVTEITGKGVGVSAAMTEMRCFSSIMSEAVRRGMRTDNPCQKLGIKVPKPKPKAEMTDEEIALIRSEIERVGQNKALMAEFRSLIQDADWNPQQYLEASFEIAIHQGCRLSETYIDLHRHVDTENEEISFHAKGDRYYTTTLHPELKGIIEAWRKEGRVWSYRLPANQARFRTMGALYWHKFLKHIGLPHLSFHCTRVTVVSRLHRAGVPEGIAMKMVNHSSSVVHQIYKRTKKEQMKGLWPTMGATT